MSKPTPTLPYDTLPAGSTLSIADDGETVTITAAGRQEPGGDVHTRAMRSSAPAAAIYSGGVLMLLGGLSWGIVNANWNQIPWWAGPLAGVFALAMFALIWRSAYHRKLDALMGPLRQTTVIAVRSQRLAIETTGPLGNESYDLVRTQIRDIKLLQNVRNEIPGDDSVIDCIALFTQDGNLIRLLPARDRDELKWTARLLRKTLGIEPVDAV